MLDAWGLILWSYTCRLVLVLVCAIHMVRKCRIKCCILSVLIYYDINYHHLSDRNLKKMHKNNNACGKVGLDMSKQDGKRELTRKQHPHLLADNNIHMPIASGRGTSQIYCWFVEECKLCSCKSVKLQLQQTNNELSSISVLIVFRYGQKKKKTMRRTNQGTLEVLYQASFFGTWRV